MIERPNRRAVIVQHVPREGIAGYRLPLENAGYVIERVEMSRVADGELDLFSPGLVVLLGGPMSVYHDEAYPWLASEIAAVRERLSANLPTLGICLGAQIIARALGADVYPAAQVEVGFASVTPTALSRPNPLAALAGVPLLHWHGDTFDLPAGAEHLASTSTTTNQAFRIGGRILALQFHAEMGVDARIHDWIEHCPECLEAAGQDKDALLADYAAHGPRAVAAGRAVITGWLKGLAASSHDVGIARAA